MLSSEKINKLSKEIDAEEVVIALYNKLMRDESICGDEVIFSDVTSEKLAAALNSAWGCIDILKFELGVD